MARPPPSIEKPAERCIAPAGFRKRPGYGLVVVVLVEELDVPGVLPLGLLELLPDALLLDEPLCVGTGTGTVVVLFVVVLVELEGAGAGTTVVELGGLLIVVCEIVVGGVAAVLLS